MKIYLVIVRDSDLCEDLGSNHLAFTTLDKAKSYIKSKEAGYDPEKDDRSYYEGMWYWHGVKIYRYYNIEEIVLDKELA